MEDLKFKTNINCEGCIAKVQSDFDSAEGIAQWEVDITKQDKILTVKSDGITEDEVIKLVNRKGFKAEPIHN